MKDFIINELEILKKSANELEKLRGTSYIFNRICKLEAAIQWVKDSPDDDNNILSDDLANLNDGKLTQCPKLDE